MHILALLAAVIGGAIYWIYRAQGAAQSANDLIDMAQDVRSAARRFGFRRKTNVHPMESVEDADVAILTIASSFFELDRRTTQDEMDAITLEAQSILQRSKADVEEMLVLGRWLSHQCPDADTAIGRMSKRLYRINGLNSLEPLMGIIKGTLDRTGLEMSQRQGEAIHTITRALKL